MKQRSNKRARSQGQGMVEFALILVLVALMAILTLAATGDQLNLTFQDIQEALTNPSDPGASSPYSCPGGGTAVLHGHKYHCQ
ncbi:MAG TPA: Flp family type IVb pilin [Candidatus Dormibacteraeota bacterium]|nr:Flp family type IVb pilin [Candidatus Dormibacteraeota bacterium]HYS01170.1 Flp family type IVb pilin [Candidatus Eisenbacteria bacterium]